MPTLSQEGHANADVQSGLNILFLYTSEIEASKKTKTGVFICSSKAKWFKVPNMDEVHENSYMIWKCISGKNVQLKKTSVDSIHYTCTLIVSLVGFLRQ